MQRSAYATQPEFTAALDLADMLVSGPLRAVHSHPDGSWTVTPRTGPSLLLTSPAQVAAYVERAHGTGPQSLAPARPVRAVEPDGREGGCDCVPAAVSNGTARPDLLQARAISGHLGELGIPAARRSAAHDSEHQAAAVRVATDHGLYALLIPPVGRPFPVLANSHRDGALDVRRIPAVTDSHVATLFAAYLRDRGVF